MKQEVITKKLFIKTFGCQMNDRDTEALVGLFLEKGYQLTAEPKEADVILVNTCSVRQHAEDRAISFLGTLKSLSQSIAHSPLSIDKKNTKSIDYGLSTMDCQQRAKRVIGLIGCMAKNRGKEILGKMPHVNLICAPANLHKIPEYVEILQGHKDAKSPACLASLASGQASHKLQVVNSTNQKEIIKYISGIPHILDVEDGARDEDFYTADFRLDDGYAQVVISTGCSNYCSYCVVPFVRGENRPRNPEDIVKEVERNLKLGIRKITLLGQNVNDYKYRVQGKGQSAEGKEEVNFIELLKKVAEVEGVEELDFLTSHPKNTGVELFEVMAKYPNIKKHLHLPMQSGSDRILGLMNRGYTAKDYLRLVKDYKAIVQGTISTDFIIGFPTETEEDFNLTKKVVEDTGFNGAFIFKYSNRPNTKAGLMADDVPEEEKERRHKILLDLQRSIVAKLKIKL